MPKKIRELKQQLQKAGFISLSKRGKGSHSYWRHPSYSKPIILSNKDGDDAKPYQEKAVNKAIQFVRGNNER